MRNLRVIFRLIRRGWRRWSKPSPETGLLSSIDPREFSDLLVSGRKQDLKTLADRLSQHARASQARASQGRVSAKPPGQNASNSKGSGMA
jgi:hypothetical protein